MSTKFKAELSLVSVCLAWGISYILTDFCLTVMGTFTLNAFRFLLAFLVAGVCAFKNLKRVNRTTLKFAAANAVLLMAVYVCSSLGVVYTSVSNAGFLCCIAVLFTPFLEFFFFKKFPKKKTFLVALVATVGIALMTLDERYRFAFGDLICIACSIIYAVYLMITEVVVKRDDVDAFHLGVFQLGFTGLYCLIISLLFETPVLPNTTALWASATFLALFCTGVSTVVQSVAQKYTSATNVSVIFCLEPLFAGIAAFLFANERLLPRAYVGALILLLSLVWMEVDIPALVRKKNKK